MFAQTFTECCTKIHRTFAKICFSDVRQILDFFGIAALAGLENDRLENNGLEQEQTYVLHTLKTFNVYDM